MRFTRRFSTLAVVLAAGIAAWAQTGTPSGQASNSQQAEAVRNEVIADRIFRQESKLVLAMHGFTPLVETYIQNMKHDDQLGSKPDKDQYFLGRLVLDEKGINDKMFQGHQPQGFMGRFLERVDKMYRINYVPVGFMQLIFLNNNFDKQHYELKFIRQQFLGQVRTMVFDAVPRMESKDTHFVGRIWVEDQDYNIVRINGTFEPRTRNNFYFHFDSWRINMRQGMWLPAYVYTEESNAKATLSLPLTMKGQVRLWGYDVKHSGQQSEMTAMQIDTAKDVSDTTNNANEVVPVQSQHIWEREAEDNVLDRMERAGILAPAGGEVENVLQTVVTNLEVTNNLNIQPEVRCRVLLTTPLESFTVGHTIVVSRGLLDVLPDEASLAMMLSHELGHIALGHRMNTKYAFSDRMIFPDENIFKQIELSQNDTDEAAADEKGTELLEKSPYKDKLTNANLFLKSLSNYSQNLTWLINAHFGNRMTRGNAPSRMADLAKAGPAIVASDINQLPALPLGSRIKLDPWDDHLELQKSKPEALLSAQDKMSFEVTPIFPNLVRFGTGNEVATQQPTATTQQSGSASQNK